jgi:hypothetical protein
MRKEFNVRIRLPQSLGDEIHRLSLKENRSQSATVSLLVSEALQNRRKAAAEQGEIMRAGHSARVAELITALTTPANRADAQ